MADVNTVTVIGDLGTVKVTLLDGDELGIDEKRVLKLANKIIDLFKKNYVHPVEALIAARLVANVIEDSLMERGL